MDKAGLGRDERRVTVAAPLIALAAGFVGGAMNALAGGGTFATLPSLLALGLPANIANATSNVALLPGAGTSAWTFRDELTLPRATPHLNRYERGLIAYLEEPIPAPSRKKAA